MIVVRFGLVAAAIAVQLLALAALVRGILAAAAASASRRALPRGPRGDQ